MLKVNERTNLKRVLFVIFRTVVKQNREGHDGAVKLARLGGGVGVDNDGWRIWQCVALLQLLSLLLLLPLQLLLLQSATKVIIISWGELPVTGFAVFSLSVLRAHLKDRVFCLTVL